MTSRSTPRWVATTVVTILLLPATGLVAGPIAMCCEAHHLEASARPDCCIGAEPGHMCPMDMTSMDMTSTNESAGGVTAICDCGSHDASLTALLVLLGVDLPHPSVIASPPVHVLDALLARETSDTPRVPTLPPPRL